LPPFLKQAITQHDVLVGMDRKMVLAAMGAPESKIRELLPGTTTDQHYEEWIYGQVPQTVRFVRFVGDRVIQVKIAALGQPIAVHTENEMQGYLDPGDVREVALGDAKPPSGDDGPAKAPPTILKPGEVAPGSTERVRLPVAAPPPGAGTGQNTSDPAAAPAAGPGDATPAGQAPSAAPGTPADKAPANQLTASVR
jgi:hypothetical protein